MNIRLNEALKAPVEEETTTGLAANRKSFKVLRQAGLLGATTLLASCGILGGDAATPQERVGDASEALKDGNCDDYVDYFVEGDRLKAKGACLEINATIEEMSVEILSTEIDGDEAKVDTKWTGISTQYGTIEDTEMTTLERVDGEWLINLTD